MGPSLLFYCKGILANFLANQYMFLGIVNGARAIVHGIVSYFDDKLLAPYHNYTNID